MLPRKGQRENNTEMPPGRDHFHCATLEKHQPENISLRSFHLQLNSKPETQHPVKLGQESDEKDFCFSLGIIL